MKLKEMCVRENFFSNLFHFKYVACNLHMLQMQYFFSDVGAKYRNGKNRDVKVGQFGMHDSKHRTCADH